MRQRWWLPTYGSRRPVTRPRGQPCELLLRARAARDETRLPRRRTSRRAPLPPQSLWEGCSENPAGLTLLFIERAGRTFSFALSANRKEELNDFSRLHVSRQS